MRPLKILFAADVHPDPSAGASGTEWQTIRALRELGHEIDELWAPDFAHRVSHGNLHYILELPRSYRAVIAKKCATTEYDAIHVNQPHCYLAAADHHARGRRGAFVYRSHGLEDHVELVINPFRRKLGIPARRGLRRLAGLGVDALLRRHDRLAYRHASGIIVSSALDALHLRSRCGVPPSRIACIMQAASDRMLSAALAPYTASRAKSVLFVGEFGLIKGVHAVAETANALYATDSQFGFTWVCRAESAALVNDLLSERARARLKVVPWTAQDNLVELYDTHGILLCPSIFEGFCKVFLEGMARGMCVIGTRAGAMPDIIDDGISGFLVPHHDPGAILARLHGLAADFAGACSMSVRAARKAREYSWIRTARETAMFYEQLIEQGQRHSPRPEYAP